VKKSAQATALGIPDRSEYGDTTRLPIDQLLNYVVQEHDTLRQPGRPHLDLRLGLGQLHSWAVPKGKMPAPGERQLAVAQPIHEGSYGEFVGEIPEGEYGAGKVKTHDKGSVLVTKAQPGQVNFVVAHRKYPERYSLIRTKGKDWLLVNTTPVTSPVLAAHQKEHYKLVPQKDVEKVLDGSYAVSAKIDGAAALFQVLKDHIEALSYRTDKEGRPIIHTHRIPGMVGLKIPRSAQGAVLRGELFAEQGGKAIPAQQLGGLLNASVENSRRRQQAEDIQMRAAIFKVLQEGGKLTDPATPPEEQIAKVQRIIKALPKEIFTTPPTTTDPAEARKLWEQIKGGKLPLTSEGIVATPLKGGTSSKVKLLNERDVYIREIFPAVLKGDEPRAGGFKYSLEPEGEVVGEVGTGFSHDLAKDMLANPNDYIGRTARVRSQGQFPKTKALRAPALLSLHEDFPMKTAQALKPNLIMSLIDKLRQIKLAESVQLKAVPGRADKDDAHEVSCKVKGDAVKSIAKLLEWIGRNGNGGHSFNIEVDPEGGKDSARTFSFDGDGSDRLHDVKINGKAPEWKEDYGCLMAYPPKELVDKVLALHKDIDPEDVYDDEGDKGLETEPHVTILYGFNSDDDRRVWRQVGNLQSLTAELGETSLFENPNYDVLKLDVTGPGLQNLHDKVKDDIWTTETHKDYKPHMTIAYLKKGKGKKYAGNKALAGTQVKFNKLVFSTSQEQKTERSIPLEEKTASTHKGEPTPEYLALVATRQSPLTKRYARTVKKVEGKGLWGRRGHLLEPGFLEDVGDRFGETAEYNKWLTDLIEAAKGKLHPVVTTPGGRVSPRIMLIENEDDILVMAKALVDKIKIRGLARGTPASPSNLLLRAVVRAKMAAAVKTAQALKPNLIMSLIDKLRQIKQLSDLKKYKDKHEKVRQIVLTHPEQFYIDSEDAATNIVGVTHRPSGFQFHVPKNVVGDVLKLEARPVIESVAPPPPATPLINVDVTSPAGEKKASFRVEVAEGEEASRKGLGGRPTMPDGYGMLFKRAVAFWMKGCNFDLDIAFLRKDGTVLEVQQMKKLAAPDEDPEIYQPAQPADLAVELPFGWCQKNNVKPGDRLLVRS
jgi:DNA ligase D-like protein (predicted 3'-phosphoesterase)